MFGQNAYILRRTDQDRCIVVDPGFEIQQIVDYLEGNAYQLDAIFNTHGHIDHIAGNKPLKTLYPSSPLIIGARDAHKLSDPEANLSLGYGMEVISPVADITVEDGELIRFAELAFETRLTPGHSPGHVVWLFRDTEIPLVINGDVLFKESVGRTDFPDGSFKQLEKAIREQLYTLPDETLVLTGHGNSTTIGHEKQHNPFVQPVNA
ncbi:MAG: MBL fold metallo-hydrolase [Planctomycetaceae bacterium]|nr:MBL fold metallo-hydrolase [Planctomycetaceae bacterium]